ncbi:lipase family protein [Alicyclobacillus mengziensis]|uniref:Lipase family protein n=1 Tax=Alicyclobacillus mengziensis TaxID=2931921 RepID=A0A9X7W2B3_9BACL|nr:lipase family protein [Alicyclobacillus mengziensis]QSO48882.1 lipase family protein [Alicyclobacillus mengziensis]
MKISLINQQTIVWGQFILCAVDMYKSGNLNPPQPTYFPAGWKLVKNIHAEAVVGFFREKEFIGFVAQSTQQSHQFACVLHGSEGIADFLDDFEFILTDFNLVQNGGKTEYGFTRYYESFSFVDPDTDAQQNLTEYLQELSNEETLPSFVVSGHSLGGALATLHAVVLAEKGIDVDVYTYGSPMVGDSKFVQVYSNLVKNSYRIVNIPDIVPQLPGTLLGYEHVPRLFEVNSLDFPQIKRSISCYHALSTSLYVLGSTGTDLTSCRATSG